MFCIMHSYSNNSTFTFLSLAVDKEIEHMYRFLKSHTDEHAELMKHIFRNVYLFNSFKNTIFNVLQNVDLFA